jgi:Resolvase, N terminal domain
MTSNIPDFVLYYRVSTQRQGHSGLGLDAQRRAVQDHLRVTRAELLAEFTEVESGRRRTRPQLAKALALCRKERATLVIAKKVYPRRVVSLTSSTKIVSVLPEVDAGTSDGSPPAAANIAVGQMTVASECVLNSRVCGDERGIEC